jgi:hypothetical protein
MDSIDTSHVPTPDPNNFWSFALYQPRMIGVNPYIDMVVTRIEEERAWVEVSFDLGGGTQKVSDWLNLDKPCVAFRDPIGIPRLTFTLRAADPKNGVAQFQITSNMRQVPRGK